MSYQFLNPAPVMLDLLGLKPAAGGSLTFYEQGTTSPLTTYSDQDGSVPNSNPVPLDSSGRSNVPIWLAEPATVVLKDADGGVIWTRDVASDSGADLELPALSPGFLTNDGTNLIWQTIREMPDPTGSTNQYPVTNGEGYTLVNVPAMPSPPDPEIVVGANSFQAGVSTDETKLLEQTGSGSATASGGKTATATIEFPTAYAAAPTFIGICPTTTSAGSTANLIPRWAVTTKSATGFTVTFSTITGGTSADNQNGSNLIGSVTFDWKATGTVEIETE